MHLRNNVEIVCNFAYAILRLNSTWNSLTKYMMSKSQLHFYLIILCYTHPKHTLRCKSIIVNDCKLAQHSASVRENGLIYFSNLSNVGNGYEIKMRLHIIFHKSPFVARPTMINSLYPIKYSINE